MFTRGSLFFIWLLVCVNAAFAADDAALLPTSLPLPPREELPSAVKVAVLQNERTVPIQFEDRYQIRRADTLEILTGGTGPDQVSIAASEGGIQIGGTFYPVDAILLDSDGKVIKVGSRLYRNRIRVLKGGGNTLTAINEVGLEDYIKGVLPLEVSPGWPVESLKAHAVVSRALSLF